MSEEAPKKRERPPSAYRIDIIRRRCTGVGTCMDLAPRTFAKFGKTSHGMVLAVKDAGGLSVLSPDKDITPGVKVS